MRRLVSSLACLVALSACAHGAVDGVGGVGGAGTSATGTGTTTSTTTTASTSGSTSNASASSSDASSGATMSSASSAMASSSASTGATMQPGAAFFSEYVEGSSNNKALEIFNGGNAPLDLADCEIDRYQNGSTTALAPIALDPVMLQPGQVFVICHSSFAQPLLCDQTSGSVQHTGNDVVELVCGGVVKDAIGKVGEDAVWGTGAVTTQDATLRRKCSVTVGDTNATDAFDPTAEWDGFPVDTYSDLGKYLCP
ncbi:MAG: lamin tail domain-containing protein [Polyangiaceae bacterium]